MRVTRERMAENRAALIESASRLFRKCGIDGVGIADICKDAGLTHGALYAHFANKQALAAEALSNGLANGYDYLISGGETSPPDLDHFLNYYLSTQTRDDLAGGCAMTASASEIARQDESVSASFRDGFERITQAMQATLGSSALDATARERALTIMTTLIGGVAVARAVVKADPALSEEVLLALRKVLGQIGSDDRDEHAD